MYLKLFFLLHFFAFSYAEGTVCYSGTLHGSECLCENILWSENSDDEIGAKLQCVGGDVLRAAIDVKSVKNDLDFTKLSLINGTLAVLKLSEMSHFKTVRNFNLSHNRLSNIESDALQELNFLESFDLSFNDLTSLKDFCFKKLSNLKNLSLSSNKISTIEPNAFYDLYGLLYLDLSYNELSIIDNNWFVSTKNLHQLIFSHNMIESIANFSSNHHLMHLQRLDLSNNRLKSIPNSAFHWMKNLKYLLLAMNQLTTLDEGVFKGNNMLEKINLIGNPWICDRKLLPLNDWLKKHEVYRGGAVCSSPPALQDYTLQQGLDILHLELRIEECPLCNDTMCSCTISRDKLVVTVDCSGRGFTRLPEVVPYMTKVINLHNNNIRSLSIDHIDANLWSDVSFLYLNNNVIDTLKGFEGSWLLRNLVALHLSNNHLTEIPIYILEQLRGGLLDELYLSGNPWICDCNTVRFQTWLQDNYRAVRNFDGICCAPDSGMYADLPIYRLKKSQLCPQQVQLVNYLDVLNGLMGFAICLLIIKLSYDYYLQKRTGKLPRFFSLNL